MQTVRCRCLLSKCIRFVIKRICCGHIGVTASFLACSLCVGPASLVASNMTFGVLRDFGTTLALILIINGLLELGGHSTAQLTIQVRKQNQVTGVAADHRPQPCTHHHHHPIYTVPSRYPT